MLLGALPAEVEALLARRCALGQDLFDEVWEGCYHMAPAPHWRHGIVDAEVMAVLRPFAKRAGLRPTGPFNLGAPDNYRVPDGGFHRTTSKAAWLTTAEIVVEVVSPDDETYEKFSFYATRGVVDVVVADPDQRRIHLFALDSDGYIEVERSDLLGVSAAELAAAIDWPA